MNKKTISLEDYFNFVDLTKKQSKNFKIFITLFVVFCLFLFLVLFVYPNE